MAKLNPTTIIGNSFLFVRAGNILHKLDVMDILWISSEGNYITINAKARKHVIKMSLRKVLHYLPKEYFTQIHRSHVVQKNYISKIDMSLNELYIDQQPLPLGRKFKENLFSQLKLLR